MIKPLWAGVASAAFLGTVGAAAIFVASSGGEEEIVQQPETGTPLASGSPTPVASVTPTPATTSAPRSGTVAPSPTPLPDGWEVYVDPQLGFSFPHPGGLTRKEQLIDLPARDDLPATQLRVIGLNRSDGVPVVGVSVTANSSGLPLEEWIHKRAGWPCPALASPTCDPVEVLIGGERGIRFSIGTLGEPAANIYFAHGGFIYALGGNVHGSGEGRYGPTISEADFIRAAERFRFAE